MPTQGQIFLNFLEVLAVNLGKGIFLAINDTSLQSDKYLRKRHRCWVGSIALEHLHSPLTFRCPEFDTLEVFRTYYRPDIVGNISEAVFPYGHDVIPRCFDLRGDHRPEDFVPAEAGDPLGMGQINRTALAKVWRFIII